MCLIFNVDESGFQRWSDKRSIKVIWKKSDHVERRGKRKSMSDEISESLNLDEWTKHDIVEEAIKKSKQEELIVGVERNSKRTTAVAAANAEKLPVVDDVVSLSLSGSVSAVSSEAVSSSGAVVSSTVVSVSSSVSTAVSFSVSASVTASVSVSV